MGEMEEGASLLLPPGFSPIKPPPDEAALPPPPLRPWTPDDFFLGSRLGGGSFSNVYVAKEKSSGFVCALKVVKKQWLARQPKLAVQLRNEVALQREVGGSHPNLLKLYACFSDARRVFLALEYCPGGQLCQLLVKRGKLTEEEARTITAQLASALAFLHSKQIVHRDVKPENVLFDKRGRVRLADFGWSVRITEGCRRATMCGTLDYIAPEVLKEGGTHSLPADLWSLGAVVHELLAGSPPYSLPSPRDTHRLLLDPPPYVPPPDFSRRAASFTSALLVKEEPARLTAQQAAQHSFLQF